MKPRRLLALVLVGVTGWLAGWFGYATVAVLPDLDQREIPWLMPIIGLLLIAACLGVDPGPSTPAVTESPSAPGTFDDSVTTCSITPTLARPAPGRVRLVRAVIP